MVLGAAVGCQTRAYERGQGEPATRGERGMISQVRHLNSTIHHAFGYKYVITKDRAFLTMGDEIFGASFATDTLRNLAYVGGKEYRMTYRSAGRYPAWRVASIGSAGAGFPNK